MTGSDRPQRQAAGRPAGAAARKLDPQPFARLVCNPHPLADLQQAHLVVLGSRAAPQVGALGGPDGAVDPPDMSAALSLGRRLVLFSRHETLLARPLQPGVTRSFVLLRAISNQVCAAQAVDGLRIPFPS